MSIERKVAVITGASQGHGSPRMAGFRQGLNEIGPTIVFIGELDLPLADCA